MYTNPQRAVTDESKELRKQAGAWMRSVRERQGLTQHDVGTFAGYRYYTQYSAIEQGVGRVAPDRYALISAALGVDPGFFARKLMRFYDPLTFDVLFSGRDIDDDGTHLREPMGPVRDLPAYSSDGLKTLRKEAGQFIQNVREEAGLTQVDMADRMGYKFYTRVSQIERGVGRVPPEDFVEFTKVLGVDPKPFVRRLLQAYDPIVYHLAFEEQVYREGVAG